jgi:hypothetical protein
MPKNIGQGLSSDKALPRTIMQLSGNTASFLILQRYQAGGRLPQLRVLHLRVLCLSLQLNEDIDLRTQSEIEIRAEPLG